MLKKDVLKALMAIDEGWAVKRLILVSKPGGEKRVSRPGAQAMVAWAQKHHGLRVIAHDLGGR